MSVGYNYKQKYRNHILKIKILLLNHQNNTILSKIKFVSKIYRYINLTKNAKMRKLYSYISIKSINDTNCLIS